MVAEHRVRLTEKDGMEMGIRCPNCKTYTSFSDILATGHCRGGWKGCETKLQLELVIQD
ncbi:MULTISPECIES: hypothetical protein [Haloferax]|uniref:Uncharacterized protein n=1 Tax=Haloferax mediterranei (strain ATCC 33500 / DSM 1411 / JCM 8866 / NBRC 14739 / NCIMB 2177 / R-4) TaxID=523841 RepID=M0J1H1_HALMT|nr:hypothetical protein [Haloferax mediterranei]EMA02801.1 hypothetical protein C439_09470 [Haloferax mediterranei ATCC 33500]MDX5988014.1 hypothetical protein [Haloferax mediterranei ATCC 33500]